MPSLKAKWGSDVHQRNIIVEPIYAVVSDYRYGKAFAYKTLKPGQDKFEQEWGVIDTEGRELFSSTTGQMWPIRDKFEANGLAIVKTNGDNDKTYALIDEYGQKMDTEGFTQMIGEVSSFANSDKAE